MAYPRSTGDLPISSADLSIILNFLRPLPSLPVAVLAATARLQNLLLPTGAASSLPSPSPSPLEPSGSTCWSPRGDDREDRDRVSRLHQQPISTFDPNTRTSLDCPSSQQEAGVPDQDLRDLPETALDEVDKLILELLEESELDREFRPVKLSVSSLSVVANSFLLLCLAVFRW